MHMSKKHMKNADYHEVFEKCISEPQWDTTTTNVPIRL